VAALRNIPLLLTAADLLPLDLKQKHRAFSAFAHPATFAARATIFIACCPFLIELFSLNRFQTQFNEMGLLGK